MPPLGLVFSSISEQRIQKLWIFLKVSHGSGCTTQWRGFGIEQADGKVIPLWVAGGGSIWVLVKSVEASLVIESDLEQSFPPETSRG